MSLVLEKIGKTVGSEIHLEDISLELLSGSLNMLLGPTLAGKTSLMRIMAGLDRPTSGRLLLDGRDVTGLSVRKRNVAMVYQQFINYPSFTVFENIASTHRGSRARCAPPPSPCALRHYSTDCRASSAVDSSSAQPGQGAGQGRGAAAGRRTARPAASARGH